MSKSIPMNFSKDKHLQVENPTLWVTPQTQISKILRIYLMLKLQIATPGKGQLYLLSEEISRKLKS
jgi:hypothetical protein